MNKINDNLALIPAFIKQLIPLNIKRIMLYVFRFGIVRGSITLYRLSKAKNGLIAISIPRSKVPIFLRANSSDRQTFEEVFIDCDYQLPLKIKPRLIVDGGANAGYTSVYFANIYPNAQIIAVEPEQSNIAILRKNTSSYPNITVLQAGIWDKRAFLRIENPKAKNCSFQVQETESEENAIQAITVEEIMSLVDAKQIDILKLDVEGAEREIMASSQSWIEKVKILVIELHDRYKPGCSEAFYSAISNTKFKQEMCKGVNIIVQNYCLK